MLGRSSTSSFEARFPIALAGAIGLLICFELALRFSGWPRIVPYELGRMEYSVAAEQIDRAGAAEVSIVGSSRTRESLVVPLMAERLSARAGRPVRVASYACSAACASDFEAVTRRLLRATPRPRVILIGVSDRDLVYAGKLWDEVAIFENLADLREGFSERGIDAYEGLPIVARHAIGRYWRTLGLRDFLRLRAVQLLTSEDKETWPSPAEGGLTVWQRSSPARNLRRSPVSRSIVIERAAALSDADMPDPQLADALDDLAHDCRDAGVALVFYETHRSSALRAALPARIDAKFQSFVSDVASRNGARYVTLQSLNLSLGDADMREPAHMSYRGAKSLTEALSETVVGKMVAGN